MTNPTQKDLHELIKSKKDLFLNLAERWEDEKEYEDIADYNEVVQKQFPSFLKGYVKNKKLNFEFACQEGKVHIHCISGSKIEAFFIPLKSQPKESEMTAKKSTTTVKKSASTSKSTKKVEKVPAKKVEKKATEKVEKKVTKKVEKVPTPKVEKKVTGKVEKIPTRKIADVIREGLKKGDDKAKILAAVQKEFPSSNTNFACIAWYKSTMKKNGEL